jgi:hypothetical protein
MKTKLNCCSILVRKSSVAIRTLLLVLAVAVVALFVVMQATGSLSNRRNNAFKNQYLPGFRSFLAQSTPALQKHFIPVT